MQMASRVGFVFTRPYRLYRYSSCLIPLKQPCGQYFRHQIRSLMPDFIGFRSVWGGWHPKKFNPVFSDIQNLKTASAGQWERGIWLWNYFQWQSLSVSAGSGA